MKSRMKLKKIRRNLQNKIRNILIAKIQRRTIRKLRWPNIKMKATRKKIKNNKKRSSLRKKKPIRKIK